jgi:hypothetical protein
MSLAKGAGYLDAAQHTVGQGLDFVEIPQFTHLFATAGTLIAMTAFLCAATLADGM